MTSSSLRPVRKLLVANRGEIACRIMRTCRDMGIWTVAVFSDADENAPHVKIADEAVRLGPGPSAESYLRIDGVLEAAKATGADAIHPGYGFLSENAAFARACEEAGINFVGPSPESIEAMGSKINAKKIAASAGVPIVPGYNGADQSDEVLVQEAREIGFPLLVKASAGGGGRGMRVVENVKELPDALEAARREAQGAFGDSTLMLERYVVKPRHIEIQILGDKHGNLVHLLERECSIQRRHQKIIEEAPSMALSEELRAEMGASAVALGKSMHYVGAGTVEFLLDDHGRFYFLEVNTRLQVEHPVTEWITGLDLVQEQIRVAEGRKLTLVQDDISPQGAALECRIYAEDPASDFLPSTGTLLDWHLPEFAGVRLDSGVEKGGEVPIFYDPMLAKLITRGHDREEARRRMLRALASFSIQGVKNNRAFLAEVLDSPAYIEGKIHTHFVEEHFGSYQKPSLSASQRALVVIAATLADFASRRSKNALLPGVRRGFRNNQYQMQRASWAFDEAPCEVLYTNLGKDRLAFQVEEQDSEVRLVSWDGTVLRWEDSAGVLRKARVLLEEEYALVVSGEIQSKLERVPRFPVPGEDEVEGACQAPMPGKVVRVAIEAGQHVDAGQILVVLEAMKMEHAVLAPEAGTVDRVLVSEGEQVEAGAVLVVMAESN